jgi:hypothetical protein
MAASKRVVSKPDVVIDRPEKQSLLGLLLGQMFRDLLFDEKGWRWARGLRGDLEIQLGQMTATVRFDGGRLVVLHGPSPAPRARLSGDMTSFVQLARAGPMELAETLFRGGVRIRGNPVFLMQLLWLVRQRRGGQSAR